MEKAPPPHARGPAPCCRARYGAAWPRPPPGWQPGGRFPQTAAPGAQQSPPPGALVRKPARERWCLPNSRLLCAGLFCSGSGRVQGVALGVDAKPKPGSKEKQCARRGAPGATPTLPLSPSCEPQMPAAHWHPGGGEQHRVHALAARLMCEDCIPTSTRNERGEHAQGQQRSRPAPPARARLLLGDVALEAGRLCGDGALLLLLLLNGVLDGRKRLVAPLFMRGCNACVVVCLLVRLVHDARVHGTASASQAPRSRPYRCIPLYGGEAALPLRQQLLLLKVHRLHVRLGLQEGGACECRRQQARTGGSQFAPAPAPCWRARHGTIQRFQAGGWAAPPPASRARRASRGAVRPAAPRAGRPAAAATAASSSGGGGRARGAGAQRGSCLRALPLPAFLPLVLRAGTQEGSYKNGSHTRTPLARSQSPPNTPDPPNQAPAAPQSGSPAAASPSRAAAPPPPPRAPRAWSP